MSPKAFFSDSQPEVLQELYDRLKQSVLVAKARQKTLSIIKAPMLCKVWNAETGKCSQVLSGHDDDARLACLRATYADAHALMLQ